MLQDFLIQLPQNILVDNRFGSRIHRQGFPLPVKKNIASELFSNSFVISSLRKSVAGFLN